MFFFIRMTFFFLSGERKSKVLVLHVKSSKTNVTLIQKIQT